MFCHKLQLVIGKFLTYQEEKKKLMALKKTMHGLRDDRKSQFKFIIQKIVIIWKQNNKIKQIKSDSNPE